MSVDVQPDTGEVVVPDGDAPRPPCSTGQWTPTQPPALAHTPIPMWERKQIASQPQVEWS